jgi:hypothetical protein
MVDSVEVWANARPGKAITAAIAAEAANFIVMTPGKMMNRKDERQESEDEGGKNSRERGRKYT